MPELPEITVYVEALEARLVGQRLQGIRLRSHFLLRTVTPPLTAAHGREIQRVHRLGKRIVLTLEGDLHLVLHLMLAGTLHWRPPGAPLPRTHGLLALDLPAGTLHLVENTPRKRAALHVLEGPAALARLDPGGLEVLGSRFEQFAAALLRENHTLKRALTDPRMLSGIGNAYSDEMLHRARLSPLQRTGNLTAPELARLHRACQEVLREWVERLRIAAGEDFPANLHRARQGMAVHGRYRQPCPDCGAPVQRIVYREREVSYCAGCQTGGRLLADRSLSRLLHDDWPRTLEAWEGLDLT